MALWIFILTNILVAAIAAIVASVITRRKDLKKVTYMMDALEDGEINFRFRENSRFNRTLNRIRFIFKKLRQQNEQESWEKLIRVLTHEIMNTVSPIASLSDALSKSVDDNGHCELDVKAGLQTISDSSKNLIKFVDDYRKLGGVARPMRKVVDLQLLVEKIISLNSEYCTLHGAECTYTSKECGIMVYADESQISQIVINLIKNAIQANAKHINIETKLCHNDDVTVRIVNDGTPIPLKNQEQIFVPFFTTKTDGNGIGLSISRQIMRLHNGSIELVCSNNTETVFELLFR